jgi:FtsP/CotA-like multicopper oxidase with cupredoxin domain
MDAVTENPAPGTTEIWEIRNFTEDAHPIHIHVVQFEIVERAPEASPGHPRRGRRAPRIRSSPTRGNSLG